MPTREVLSPAQRASLLTIPDDLSERELARYYTFSEEDRIIIKRHRKDKNRLGFAVQLSHLRFPGWPWDPTVPLPESIVAYIAGQLDLDPSELAAYATRDPTRREHLKEIQRDFGFRPFSMGQFGALIANCGCARLLFRPSLPLRDSPGKRADAPGDKFTLA